MSSKIIAIAVVAVMVTAGAGIFLYTSNKESGVDLNATSVTLSILGNADGNYKLDGGDVNTIQDYVDGKIDEKELKTVIDSAGKKHYLADANADGKVDGDDVKYLRSVLDRTAPKIHFLDGHDNFKSVPMKINKIVAEFYTNCEILKLVGAQKSIVATDRGPLLLKDYYLQGIEDPEKSVFNMGSHHTPDYENVAKLEPEVWMTYGGRLIDEKSEKTKAVVFGLNLTHIDFEDVYRSGVIKGTLLAGYIFDNVPAAEKYVKWVIDLWTYLKDKSSEIEERDKPTVLYTRYSGYIKDQSADSINCFIKGSNLYQAVKLAGGKNFIDDVELPSTSADGGNVSLEKIVDTEIDYMFLHSIKFTGGGTVQKDVPMHGYTCDDPAEWLAEHDKIANMEPFRHIENVYLTPGDFMNNTSGGLLNATLVAKTIHPDVFKDLDAKKKHQEYIDIMGFDFDLEKHGVFFKY